MPSHDPEDSDTPPPLSERASHGQYPDEISRRERDEVSTQLRSGNGSAHQERRCHSGGGSCWRVF